MFPIVSLQPVGLLYHGCRQAQCQWTTPESLPGQCPLVPGSVEHCEIAVAFQAESELDFAGLGILDSEN